MLHTLHDQGLDRLPDSAPLRKARSEGRILLAHFVILNGVKHVLSGAEGKLGFGKKWPSLGKA